MDRLAVRRQRLTTGSSHDSKAGKVAQYLIRFRLYIFQGLCVLASVICYFKVQKHLEELSKIQLH